MSYPSEQDTATARRALSDAESAIERARYALRTEPFAREALDEAVKRINHARQVAHTADDYWKGRLTEKPAEYA